MAEIAGCFGLLIAIVVGLLVLNAVVWFVVTFLPYAVLAILVVVCLIMGFAGSRY